MSICHKLRLLLIYFGIFQKKKEENVVVLTKMKELEIMQKYGSKSRSKLATTHPDLQLIFNEAIKSVDITIMEGVRALKRQEELVRTGMSKTLNSKHLKNADDGTSHAVDAALWKVVWEDRDKFVYLGGFILALARKMYENGEISHILTWGGDWDSDQNFREHSLFDGPHFELKKP